MEFSDLKRAGARLAIGAGLATFAVAGSLGTGVITAVAVSTEGSDLADEDNASDAIRAVVTLEGGTLVADQFSFQLIPTATQEVSIASGSRVDEDTLSGYEDDAWENYDTYTYQVTVDEDVYEGAVVTISIEDGDDTYLMSGDTLSFVAPADLAAGTYCLTVAVDHTSDTYSYAIAISTIDEDTEETTVVTGFENIEAVTDASELEGYATRVVATATNDESGEVVFDITDYLNELYADADDGTYTVTFTMTQVEGEDDSIEYDLDTSVIVTAKVIKTTETVENEDGEEETGPVYTVSASYSTENVFANTVKCGTLEVALTSKSEDITSATVTVTIYDETGEKCLVESHDVTTGESLSIDLPDGYTYEVTADGGDGIVAEVDVTSGSITYDETSTVTVTLSYETVASWTPTATVVVAEGEDVSSLVYWLTDSEGTLLSVGTLGEGVTQDGLTYYPITFDEISYDGEDAGELSYTFYQLVTTTQQVVVGDTISEESTSAVDDSITAAMVLTVNDDGSLTYTISYTDADGASAEEAVFLSDAAAELLAAAAEVEEETDAGISLIYDEEAADYVFYISGVSGIEDGWYTVDALAEAAEGTYSAISIAYDEETDVWTIEFTCEVTSIDEDGNEVVDYETTTLELTTDEFMTLSEYEEYLADLEAEAGSGTEGDDSEDADSEDTDAVDADSDDADSDDDEVLAQTGDSSMVTGLTSLISGALLAAGGALRRRKLGF